MVRAAGRTWSQPGFVQDLTHPVVCVSAADAEAFAAWLSKKTGARLSLPTEAQWEYAARAGGRRMEYATYTGDIGRDQANMRGTHGPDEWTRTAPVGSFAPNPLGLYDMSGNVYEWVRDAYRPDAYKSAAFAAEGSNGSGDGAPHDPVVEGGGPRGKRGGSYALPEPYLRTANRGSNPLAADDIGFRLVRLP
jgi:formylglycine-generating enzyme required for sulfatase activity